MRTSTRSGASAPATELILERAIDFEKEISVIVARGPDGSDGHVSSLRKLHRNHILDITVVPAASQATVEENAAADLARAVAEKMDLVGLLAVEMFLQADGSLLVNELAPRPHNSGHWTIEGCVTSQFEQHVRAVCGLPLGSTEILRPAAMANLLGDLWADGEPNWAAALEVEGVHLHLYGKREPRPRPQDGAPDRARLQRRGRDRRSSRRRGDALKRPARVKTEIVSAHEPATMPFAARGVASRQGQAVALPTETVYGLAADAYREDAVLKIFQAKSRPRFDPLIVHLPDADWVERSVNVEDAVRSPLTICVISFWPGPLTFVFPRRPVIADIVTAGLETRCHSHQCASSFR